MMTRDTWLFWFMGLTLLVNVLMFVLIERRIEQTHLDTLELCR